MQHERIDISLYWSVIFSVTEFGKAFTEMLAQHNDSVQPQIICVMGQRFKQQPIENWRHGEFVVFATYKGCKIMCKKKEFQKLEVEQWIKVSLHLHRHTTCRTSDSSKLQHE